MPSEKVVLRKTLSPAPNKWSKASKSIDTSTRQPGNLKYTPRISSPSISKSYVQQNHDPNTLRTRSGEEDHELFHDVSSLNRTLAYDSHTLDLFAHIEATSPSFARKCWTYFREVSYRVNRYDIAARYIPDIELAYEDVKKGYESNTRMYDDPQMGKEHFVKFNENKFVSEVSNLMKLAIHKQQPGLSEELSKLAYEVVGEKALSLVD